MIDENELIHRAYDLRKAGSFDESFECVKGISPAMPGYAALMGWHQMRLGQWTEGFSLLERELGIYRADAVYSLPKEKRFEAGMSMEGKRILFALEGGFGDEIAYARFAPLLAARGVLVVVGCSPRLVEVVGRMSNMPPVVNLKTIDHSTYDHYICAMSVIALLDIAGPQKDITFPYLAALPQEVMQWRAVTKGAAQGKKKIGIHWQGNWEFDYIEQKSPPAKEMLRLSEAGRLFSLQRDAGENQLPQKNGVFDAEAGAPSWERSIAVLSLMDYVVTNDTSTAHLAGALGKKTLVLVPHAPHHYFLPKGIKEGNTWRWYPSATIFRQPSVGDWVGAIDAVLACVQNDTTV